MARGIGWIDEVHFAIAGWAAEPGVENAIQVLIEVFQLNDSGSVIGPAFLSRTILADENRPDVPAHDSRVRGSRHGFYLPLSADEMPNGGFIVRARALAAEHGWLLPGEVRFARVSTEDPQSTFSLRYRGLVEGLERPNDYEAYPTVMLDGDVIKMWFAGGPGDKIYYATSTSPSGVDGFKVYGNYRPVLQEDPTGPDSGLTADPSVVKVPFPDPHVPYRYFMYYTAVPSIDGRNGIFVAISTDGIHWIKMDPRDHSFGRPYPIITPQNVGTQDYGVGQSSVIWSRTPLGGMPPGFLHYFTDASVAGPCVAVSTDGGWSFQRCESPLRPHPGHYTWDMKRLESGEILGFVALPGESFIGPDGRERVRGSIGITVSRDGRHFSPHVRVPMQWLTADYDRLCINNGGLLGTPEGYIPGDSTVFYFGAGYAMQDGPRPYGRWPPQDWDIAAVSVRFQM